MIHDTLIFSRLKDRDLSKEGLIIGEGRFLAERVAASCPLVAAAAVPEAREKMEGIIQGRCPLYELSRGEISRIAGYDFHRGMLIAAERPGKVLFRGNPLVQNGTRILICAGIGDPENLGTIIRTALAMGWEGVALDAASTDPFSRKALRCSMGASLSMPLMYFDSPGDIASIKEQGWKLAGALLEDNAPAPSELKRITKLALMLGNEGFGLPEKYSCICDIAVCIPQLQNDFVDSLNVSAAAAILLWEGRRNGNA